MIKSIVSAAIIIIVLLAVFYSLSHLADGIPYGEYNNDCIRSKRVPGQRNVIIRVDDIQSYFLKDVQIRMVEDAIKMNKTLSLSVIPYKLTDDKDMIKFLEDNKCKVEIGLHGYNNEEMEFANLSYKEASKKIEEGLKVLNKIDADIIAFIPPNNEYSEETEMAIYEHGMRVISAERLNSDYGYTQSSYDWNSYQFVDSKTVLEGCNKTLNQNRTCIIMLHPQDYTTNEKFNYRKYQHYLSLLDGIDKLNATTITFRDLYHKGVVRL